MTAWKKWTWMTSTFNLVTGGRAPARLSRPLMNQVGYRMLPKDMKEILMLQAMLDCQAELCALLEVPPGLKGVQEASIGMVKEAAELIEEVHPGSRAWRRVDYEAADKEAIDVLLYLLEYFVLRGYDADDMLNAYYEKAEIVSQRQLLKAAPDKTPEVEDGIFQEQTRLKVIQDDLRASA